MNRNKTQTCWLLTLLAGGMLLSGCSSTKLYRGVYDGIIKGAGDAFHDVVFDLVDGIVGMGDPVG